MLKKILLEFSFFFFFLYNTKRAVHFEIEIFVLFVLDVLYTPWKGIDEENWMLVNNVPAFLLGVQYCLLIYHELWVLIHI